MRFRARAGLVAAGLIAALLGGCTSSSTTSQSSSAGNVIKIGVELPLSGGDAANGIPTDNGVKLAVEEANKTAPAGFSFAVDDLDDAVQGAHDPAQGAQNIKSFVADGDVVAALGPMNSNVAIAEIPIGNEAGLAQITMAATANELTHAPGAVRLRPAHPDRPAFFRVCASDDRQGGAAAAFARSAGLRRAFVIDDNESYGKGLADVFASAFAAAGGSVIGREHLTPFGLDFKPLLTKVKAAAPDLVFFGGIVSTGGAVLRKQMPDAGLGNVPYFGGDGLESPEYLPLAGKAADGTYFTLVEPDPGHLPAALSFVSAYRARFGQAPGSYSPAGYAAALVAIDAIRRALVAHPGRAPTRDEVLTGVASTVRLVTPVGPVAFDPNGDLRRPVISLYRIRGGRIEFVRQSGG
jgi:branched-chain amino acid transport system substrate-binding protein